MAFYKLCNKSYEKPCISKCLLKTYWTHDEAEGARKYRKDRNDYKVVEFVAMTIDEFKGRLWIMIRIFENECLKIGCPFIVIVSDVYKCGRPKSMKGQCMKEFVKS